VIPIIGASDLTFLPKALMILQVILPSCSSFQPSSLSVHLWPSSLFSHCLYLLKKLSFLSALPYIAYGCHWCWTCCATAWPRELQPAATAPYYFGELEEALIHGTRTSVDHGMIGTDVDTELKSMIALFLCTSLL
jgi:hypothetical protein